MEEIHYLYKITNLVNGKLYIGVTKDPKHRQECHFSNGDRLVNKAYTKYGKDNLIFEIICVGSKEYIYDLEIKAIELYKSDATTGHGYNICSGGFKGDSGNKGRTHTVKVNDKPHFVSGFWFPNRRTALKALNWGAGKFNSRKSKGILGSTKDTPRKYGKQDPVYVMGFWFPNKKKVMSTLNISLDIFQRRKLEGTLGNIVSPERKSNSTVLLKPCYFKGFWFDSYENASKVFNMKPEAIRQRILRGYYEECNSKQEQNIERYSNTILIKNNEA